MAEPAFGAAGVQADTRILITGGQGQVGFELQAIDWPAHVTLHAPGRDELDLSDPASVARLFAANRYAAVINPAAYTAVDKAEADVAAAFAVNAYGPALLADATREAGIPLIHVSTDYVFDGDAQGVYVESDPVAPIGVYGASKLAGELAVRTGNPRSVILRTAWVLSPHRNNFLKTMLRLAGDRPELRVVNDQRGSPTSARDIAEALQTITLRMIEDASAPTGVFHFVNEGDTTWAGLAEEIMSLSRDRGGAFADVVGIPSSDYPTPARRPTNSRLSTARLRAEYGITPRPWREAVSEIVDILSAREI